MSFTFSVPNELANEDFLAAESIMKEIFDTISASISASVSLNVNPRMIDVQVGFTPYDVIRADVMINSKPSGLRVQAERPSGERSTWSVHFYSKKRFFFNEIDSNSISEALNSRV